MIVPIEKNGYSQNFNFSALKRLCPGQAQTLTEIIEFWNFLLGLKNQRSWKKNRVKYLLFMFHFWNISF